MGVDLGHRLGFCRVLFGRFPRGFGSSGISVGDHACTDGCVGESIDDDEGPGGSISFVGVEIDRLAQGDRAASDFVQLQIGRRRAVESIDIDSVSERIDLAGDGLRGVFEQIGLAWQERIGVEPNDGRIELIRGFGYVPWSNDHIAA